MSRLFLVAAENGAWEVLKQIDPARQGNEADVKRFENEINLAGSLAAKGVGVVPVKWVGRVDGQLAYTMPYCAGGSLRDRLRSRGGKPLAPPDAARLACALARTVQKLQESQPPIVHRDLKPENVLFPEESADFTRPLIADLGLAKVLGQEGLTRSGAALGTWVHMAPEQVRDPARVDGRADVYALGVILYECLTGRRPFGGETAPEIIHRIYNETPIDPSKLVEGIPGALEEIVRKCLQKEPADRYATARELADDLERFLAGASVQARRPGRVAKLRSWSRRHPTEALAYAAALGALVMGLVVSVGLAIVAVRNARDAKDQARNARREAHRADDNAGLINGALGRLVRRIGQDRRMQTAGLTSFRKELLHDAVEMYDELVQRNPGEGTLGLGEALNNQTFVQYLLGEMPQAAASARLAEATLSGLPPTYEARRALADARKQLGVVDFAAGRHAEGLKKTEEAVASVPDPHRRAARQSRQPLPTCAGDGQPRQLRDAAESGWCHCPLPRGPRDPGWASQGVARRAPLYRVAGTNDEQPRADPGRHRKDQVSRRIPSRSGCRGRADPRRIPEARCPGDVPEQPGRSPGVRQGPRRGRAHLSPGSRGLPNLGQPVPQRHRLPMERGHGLDQHRGRCRSARPRQGSP